MSAQDREQRSDQDGGSPASGPASDPTGASGRDPEGSPGSNPGSAPGSGLGSQPGGASGGGPGSQPTGSPKGGPSSQPDSEGGGEPRVVLVRHGETAWSLSGQHTGRTDIPLTAVGRQQATTLGARLQGRKFALVLTSPLSRAADTCRLAGFGDQAEVSDDLMEWDYGDYEGLRSKDIRVQRPGWLIWRDGVPGGERIGNVSARADRVVDRVLEATGPVLLFGHGHLLRIFATCWLGVHPQVGGQLVLSPASISILGTEHGNPAIVHWNDTTHLSE